MHCFGSFRQLKHQHSIPEGGLHLLLVDVIRQSEATEETPVIPLDAVKLLALLLFLLLSLTFDCQNSAVLFISGFVMLPWADSLPRANLRANERVLYRELEL